MRDYIIINLLVFRNIEAMSESAESACFALNSLPELPFRRIVSFLSPGDLLRLASVSRELFELIRRDDSLWVAHLEEYAFGRWDEVLKDVSVLDGDPYISDWFSHHFRKLHHHRQKAWRERNPEKKEVRFPKGKVDETSSKRRKELTDEEKNGSSSDDYENAYESWIRIHDPLFTIERTILQASYEQYEDDPSKLPAGVLRRRYVYDIGLYKRKVVHVCFLFRLPYLLLNPLNLE